MAGASRYKTLYFPDADDFEAIRAKAKEKGLSVSELVREAALGRLEVVDGISAERARALDEEARYWRERFEKMATLAQDMQAEILQLRQELRLTRVAHPAATPGAPPAGGAAGTPVVTPDVLKALASLRSADGLYRVWTEAELREELDASHDPARRESVRLALAELYRLNLVEPQRNGWRYRD